MRIARRPILVLCSRPRDSGTRSEQLFARLLLVEIYCIILQRLLLLINMLLYLSSVMDSWLPNEAGGEWFIWYGVWVVVVYG